MSLAKLIVNSDNTLLTDKFILDENREIAFISIIGYKSNIDKLFNNLNKEKRYCSFYLKDVISNEHIKYIDCYPSKDIHYEIITKKDNSTDYTHAIIYRKNIIKEHYFKAFVYQTQNETDEDLYDKIYDLINIYSSIPVLREWMPIIVNDLNERSKHSNSYIIELKDSSTYSYQSNNDLTMYSVYINDLYLKDLISDNLSEGILDIEGSNNPSDLLFMCNGLDSYLDIFGEALAEKIQNNFTPKFVPNRDKYDKYIDICDDFIHSQGIELYEAQKAVSQAIVNNWKVNNNTLLVGECGAGKTIISSMATYAHHANSKKGFNAIVMCPTHIVEKWKREVEMAIPNTESHIVHNINELLALEPKLKNKNRASNMFLIISKESAKLNYDERPAVKWSKSKEAFVCPQCGKVITKRVYEGRGKKRTYQDVPLTMLEFAQKAEYNQVCTNTKYHSKDKCKCKLWTALNKDDIDNEWIKLSNFGWIMKDHINILLDEYIDKKQYNKKEEMLLKALIEQSNYYDENNTYNVTYKGSKKYSVAKYIKERMSNIFDYGIIDELHNLASKDSIQGQAFHYILQSCKRNVAMTGTLINGYADSIFFILYKMFPNIMINNGFKYNEVSLFIEKYGVLSYKYAKDSNTGNKKKLPGISPLIFTDYLSNNTVFISLKDMKDELPPYQEIPIGIDMDDETAEGYNDMEGYMKEILIAFRKGEIKNIKIVSSIIQELMNYPDAPHCSLGIKDPEDGKVKYVPQKLEYNIRNKDEILLSTVRDKIEAGEKVLIYYNAVNKTDIGKRLTELLENEGYNTYELKASVKSEKRESLIKEKINEGLDVLICNPSLVSTGLDLIEFTTIIFYQVGYNLYTLRQASRRSWRLSQKNPVTVYYLYYNDTVQTNALSLMATKLHAAKSMEGDFDEEGLKSMSENTEILTQIANNVVNGISDTVDSSLFESANYIRTASNNIREHKYKKEDIAFKFDEDGIKIIVNEWDKINPDTEKLDNNILLNPVLLFNN